MQFPFYKKIFAQMMSTSSKRYNRLLENRKRELFKEIKGKVLEIGAGTGANLAYYPKNIEYIALEPNDAMHPYLKKEIEREGFSNTKILNDSAENISFKDGNFDYVISSLVLCSVSDPKKVFEEILRVLKPGGKFLFIEHIAAPRKTLLYAFQHYLVWIWKICGDGCNPDRETDIVLRQTSFKDIQIEKFRLPITLFASPHMIGKATK